MSHLRPMSALLLKPDIRRRLSASDLPSLSGSAVRHAPIDCRITRFKVALLIARTRPRLVGGHAGPNPGDLFYASLLVLGNNDFIAPHADLDRWSTHKLTHIDD